MNTIRVLTVKRVAALGRLAALQKRAQRVAASATPVVSAAITDLTDALEELHVAAEHLQQQMDELSGVRQELLQSNRRHDEFLDILPFPCIWTTADGAIAAANRAAADLLNVSAAKLEGRPLLLFMTERERFTEALTALGEGLTQVIELDAVVRPRERRPRTVHLTGRRLEHDQRFCWFLAHAEEHSPAAPTASK